MVLHTEPRFGCFHHSFNIITYSDALVKSISQKTLLKDQLKYYAFACGFSDATYFIKASLFCNMLNKATPIKVTHTNSPTAISAALIQYGICINIFISRAIINVLDITGKSEQITILIRLPRFLSKYIGIAAATVATVPNSISIGIGLNRFAMKHPMDIAIM